LQIPLRTASTVSAYISNKDWRRARISCCPLHPNGGCSLRRHGSYARLTSPGVRVARWYCPEGRKTFSLLPDFLAVRLRGLLTTIENDVTLAATAKSLEAAADTLRGPDISLSGAVRWLRRRVTTVRKSIAAAVAMAPQLTANFLQCSIRDKTPVLSGLRGALPPQILGSIPAPLGFQLADRPTRSGA